MRKWIPLILVWIFFIISTILLIAKLSSESLDWKYWIGGIGLALILAITIVFSILTAKKAQKQ